ncbi:bifunctional folylpolyglutamate synthase/dihydrofolate synthase, partial [bacterium]|nr:bifunctional folylpolyglutamate synthase/dihydrofolate synthase [bacterium]
MKTNSAQQILQSKNKFLIKLGLERIKAVVELLGNPQKNYKIIHIAGTNGKGSTSKILNDILICDNYNVGLFTSPHIFNYEERIKFNNDNINSYIFNKLINRINNLALENKIELTEFELLTATAFYYFSLKKADYVILEVGLGGLYDATNVVIPELSIITTIDFDHTERLGNSIEEIANQKAGIIKENKPVIINSNNLGFEVIKKIANQKQSPLIVPPEIQIEFKDNKNYAIIEDKKYKFNLLGSHQKENLALAYCASKMLKIHKSALTSALKNVKWMFRLQFDKEKNLLIDCAHNP